MSHRDLVAAAADGFRRPGQHRHLRHRGHGSDRAAPVRRAVSSRSGAHALRQDDPAQFPVRRLRLREGLGSRRPDRSRSRITSAQSAGDRNVFFFVSGGVDSTVAYTLCLRALGPERVHGTYVDTGLMREGETEFVRRNFADAGRAGLLRRRRRELISGRACRRHRSRAEAPHHRREVRRGAAAHSRKRAFSRRADGFWAKARFIPTPSNPAARAKADLIKTHHNRVAGIQKLIDEGRIIEPLSSFYKDEVRAIGRELGTRAGIAGPPSVPRPRPGDSLPVFGLRRQRRKGRRRLDSSGALRRRAGRFAHLPAGAGARSPSRPRTRRPPT